MWSDPTFLIFGSFSCDASPVDPCTLADAVLACAFTCVTCPVCADPEPIEGFDVVIQYGTVGDSLAVYFDSAAVVAGAQFIVQCEVGGRELGAAAG